MGRALVLADNNTPGFSFSPGLHADGQLRVISIGLFLFFRMKRR